MNSAATPARSIGELFRRAKKAALRARRERMALARARNARVVTGLGFALALAACAAFPRLRAELWATAAFAAAFVPLVARSRRLASRAQAFDSLAAYYERQRRRRAGKAPRLHVGASSEPTAGANQPESSRIRALATDLSLDGPKSLRAWLDETTTEGGRIALLGRLTADPGTAAECMRRQARVRSLAQRRWPLLRARLAGDRAQIRLSTYELLRLVARPLLPSGAGRQAAAIVCEWLALVAVALAAGTGLIALGWAPVALVIYAVLANWTLQSWGPVFLRGEGVAHHGRELARVWASLARLCRSSPVAAELLPTLHAETSSDRPAVALRRLGIALAACSVESHPLIYLTVNSVLPWSALASLWLERERAALAESLPKAVREMHEFEAWTSLALYAAEHGGAWPEFVAEARLEVDGLAHPLLPAATAVGNSFRLARTKAGGEATALLTGSNMSGKSTFLRALGCNQLFACAGAPVRAERYTCGPLAVETCVQIADSLANGVSYFYAEVLRLRDILAAAREKNRMALVLVDEIFRGTNNRERLAGSRAVIRALASSGALAAVSTHDLELTTLASEGVGNWHFRDDVKDGRLGFDYRVRPGPCPTTNALLIMRQEGLPVPEPQAPEPGSD